MFASRARNQAKEPARGKSWGIASAPDREGARKLNPIWRSLSLQSGIVQLKQLECGCGANCPNTDQGRLSEENKHLQAARYQTSGDAEVASPSLSGEALRTAGRQLDPTTRTFMEYRFGHDFGHVRVHDGERASASASALGAKAYTYGSDIVFGAGGFAPGTPQGRHLLAHELTHVVQQESAYAHGSVQEAPLTVSAPSDRAEREADRVADAVDDPGSTPLIVERPAAGLSRAPLDVDKISADAQNLATTTVQIGVASVPPMALLFFKYNGHASGEIAKAADYPTTFTMPADKSKRVAPKDLPKADATAPLSNIPVEAHFFPTLWPAKGRAVVLGGFHGDEHPGWQVTDALVSELSQAGGAVGLAFNTIIVPRVNAAAIEDELAGVNLWRNRCNRQLVDLNRNFPTGAKPKDTDCRNTVYSKGVAATTQPEVQGVMDIITKFKPDRIVSTHAISNPKSAGVFADPNQDPKAIELARGMSSVIVNTSDRAANKLGPGVKDFNAVYPGDKPGVVNGGTSLGAWGPTAISGQTAPVITIEAPEFKPLGSGPGSAARTVEGFVRPLHAFLGDPKDIVTAADRDILADIDAFNTTDRVAFLTGLLPQKDDIFRRIGLRVDTAIAKLNAMSPPKPITNVSDLRLFAENVGANSAQAKIDFDKFFLVGGMSNGWDTLPDRFFKNGKRSDGADRAKWLATPSKDRLDIILKFSSLPGTSRHHWGTEVDLNSTTVADWQPASGSTPAGKFFALGQWLQANAASAGILQAYTSGRTGGYNEEAWHYSYAPISLGLRERYNQVVNLQTDVIDKIVAEFKNRAKAAGESVPSDFATALQQINISDLVNDIGPGL
jgi:predicted deacylase